MGKRLPSSFSHHATLAAGKPAKINGGVLAGGSAVVVELVVAALE